MNRLDITAPEWTAFVGRAGNASPFHSPAWALLVSEVYGFSPFALCLADASGRITSGIPVVEVRNPLTKPKWVSLPFTDFCPPLFGDGADAGRLAAGLDDARREAGIRMLEVRARLEGAVPSLRSDAVRHVLELAASPEEVARRFKRGHVRRNIAKAEREGVVIRRADEAADVLTVFYRLHLATRHRQGIPIQPRRFFRLLWQRVLDPGLGFCLLAYARGRAVAGAVFLASDRTMTYKYGASDVRYWPLRANNLLFWRAIELGCEGGFGALDFGRTDLANRGLRDFKSAWGAVEESLVYSTLGAVGRRGRFGTALLGPVIRHSPEAVCRAVGEAVYRYAA